MLKHGNTPFCGLGISTLFMLAMIYQTARSTSEKREFGRSLAATPAP
ncbi:hypothetical protein HMPREF9997_00962 [Corynebacterium durum F0235]|uniref:Uncharacterized protein n=1 Tax=Corynebacterium durum F0235 TaxID=1035195 RepID=L1MI09_9CORY|nr:hypothetical protein HMPREF9997_00962 [Corynebacterium durum F0235]